MAHPRKENGMRFLKNLGWVTAVVALLVTSVVGGVAAVAGIAYGLAYYVHPHLGAISVVGIVIVILIFVIATIVTMDETGEL